MPVIADLIQSLDKIKEIHKSKNDDYATEGNPFFNFDIQEDFINMVKSDRDKVFFGMLGLKVARIANLLNKVSLPNNESLEDSFIDLATYVLLHKADWVRRKKTSLVNPELANKA